MTLVLAGGRLLPRPLKTLLKKFWDPWSRRVPAARPARGATQRLTRSATYDILCFSIIDWSFRWQRPQQLLSRLADAGHRVFTLRTTQFLAHAPGGPLFEVHKVRDNVWEIVLAPPEDIEIFSGSVGPKTREWFPRFLDALRRELDIVSAVSLVQIATWTEVAMDARRRLGWRVVYDCMDDWATFPRMQSGLIASEERLVAEADLVTVSAQRLLEKWRGRNPHLELVRNAADFEHFSAPADRRLLEDVPRPVAGYFGAIADWFDIGLLATVAAQRPDCSFVLIGGVFDVDVTPLQNLPNVHLLGQQPYGDMPAHLREFDVCLVPFVVNRVTAATDPVKFYEYLSQGKPVVSTPMPELEQYRDLLYFADNAGEFARQLDAALDENDPALRERRIEVARRNTWTMRADTMRRAIRDAHPPVSVIVISYDNRELTEACLDSVLQLSMHPNLEVIVIDNASTDGSAEMLAAMRDDRVHVILNAENAGFAAANNQGLRAATGQYLILLNNDTVVPRGWIPRMLRHLDDPAIGLAVAVTNFSGNESRIEVPYRSIEQMHVFAEGYMREHEGERFDIDVAAMYCVGMRRDVYERIGPLDEQFGIGMFEDDDYSHRARLAGLRVVCTEDVFVHHVGQASFSRIDRAEYDALWERNQAHFEAKWGIRWQPHKSQ